MDDQRVVLDTDFIQAITDYRDGDGADLFRRIFSSLGKIPVVHPYVAANELSSNSVAQSLISSGDIKIIPYDDFLPQNGIKRVLYKKTFYDLHRIIREEQISRKGDTEMMALRPEEDIFRRQSGRSFGEIHSILMAAELRIPLFYSNDGGAKIAAGRYPEGRLTVQNAEEVANLLSLNNITGAERRFIKKYRRHR